MMDASFPVLFRVALSGAVNMTSEIVSCQDFAFSWSIRDWGKTPVWRFMFF